MEKRDFDKVAESYDLKPGRVKLAQDVAAAISGCPAYIPFGFSACKKGETQNEKTLLIVLSGFLPDVSVYLAGTGP
jgi:hypothetical protein